jgi:hypothetical protein
VVGEAARDLRVERTAAALANRARGFLGTRQHALEGGVHGDLSDPDRQRHLVALRPAQHPLAVPALNEVRERVGHVPG